MGEMIGVAMPQRHSKLKSYPGSIAPPTMFSRDTKGSELLQAAADIRSQVSARPRLAAKHLKPEVYCAMGGSFE